MQYTDLIIVGAGPAGYHAAVHAAEQGLRVALIESEAVGGTCLNWGCIPTKALLFLAKQFSLLSELPEIAGNGQYDHRLALSWKNRIVNSLNSDIQKLLCSRRVDLVRGRAEIQSLTAAEKVLQVSGISYSAQNLILATGASNWVPPITITESTVLDSRALLELENIPKRLCIVGGGAIGVEFAFLYAALGSAVTLVEREKQLLPSMDAEVAEDMQAFLQQKSKVELHLSAKIEKVAQNELYFFQDKGDHRRLPFDVLLMCTGVRVNCESFIKQGVHCSRQGIAVDSKMRTNIHGLYAIGDVTGTSQLAHSAYRMAEVAVNAIVKIPASMRYHAIPQVVYGFPECASCGMTEREAREQGVKFASATFPMRISGRHLAEKGDPSLGFCKILAEKKSGCIIGMHIVGHYASEIISLAAVFLEHEMRVQEISEMIFPHPSISELVPALCKRLQQMIRKGESHA